MASSLPLSPNPLRRSIVASRTLPQSSRQYTSASSSIPASAQVVTVASRIASTVAPSAASALKSRSSVATYAGPQYHSKVEEDLVNARQPLALPTTGPVKVGPYSGLHLNKHEELAFKGPRPLSSYAINEDPSPHLIRKQSAPVKYTQQVSVRRLNPPTPAPHGDLIVREFQKQIPAAPPVVLRQEGRRAPTPPPLIYREAPPAPPPRVPSQIVEVEGTPVPPPPRRVVYEKLPDQPQKPQNIVIEKWLPYKPRTRRVVYERSCVPPPPNPRNLVIEWDQPCVQVDQVCVDLGVCDADPEEYIRQFGCELKQPCEIPNVCSSCPGGQRESSSSRLVNSQIASSALASSSTTTILEGDVQALKLVDLERYGLTNYRRYL